MAAITKDTECFVFLPGEQFAYETTDFPSQKHILQTYYGDIEGSNPPKDLVLLVGDKLGLAQGQVVVDAGIEYQLLSFSVTVRESGGLFGWGAGKYREERRPVYVKSEIITLDKIWAEQERDKRLNKDKIAAQKALDDKNKLLTQIADGGTEPQTGNTQTGTGLNITSIIVIVFAFLGLIIGGVLWWKGKQNKKVVSPKPINN